MWNWRLLLATGDARYADLIERTLYNGFAAGLSLDGRSYYYTNPLHVRSGHETQSSQGSGTAAQREPWYTCACCPPNIMRLISSLAHYVATIDDDGVQIHQYGAGTMNTRGADGPAATLRVRTGYPWSGSVQITVEETTDEPWTLSLRTPAWSHDTTVSVEGSDATAERDPRGYLRIRRRWRPGDRVSLELDLAARLTAPHPRVDAVRGCVAIERGPLVYAVEQVDLPSGVVLDDIRLTADPQLRVAHRPDLLGGVTTVTAKAVVRRPGSRSLYASLDGSAGGDAAPDDDLDVTAVPYYAWANREADAMRVWLPRA
jgi:DUF1680 family protein